MVRREDIRNIEKQVARIMERRLSVLENGGLRKNRKTHVLIYPNTTNIKQASTRKQRVGNWCRYG